MRYPISKRIGRLTDVFASLFAIDAPSIEQPGRATCEPLGTGRKFARSDVVTAIGCCAGARLPVADMLGEWFETDLLSAALAAPGVSGTMFGPRSAGSALVLLMH